MKLFKLILLPVSMIFIFLVGWRLYRPVEIVSIHQNLSFSDVLVKNFPITNKGKLDWWKENKNKLNDIYGVPKEDRSYGTYYITFWDFNDGCETDKENDFLGFSEHEPYCFYDIKAKKNCIDKKNEIMKVNRTTAGSIRIQLGESSYIELKNGEIVKEKK